MRLILTNQPHLCNKYKLYKIFTEKRKIGKEDIMIKLTTLQDCDNINNPISTYIKAIIKRMIEEYSVDSISDFGAVYLVENKSDIENLNEMVFNNPISEFIPEYIKRIYIDDSFQDLSYLESCFIFSDGFGVIIIGAESQLEKHFDVDKYLIDN